ncbi:carbohydrate kinase family protein [Pirellulaceae bacterium SH467]
MIRNASNRPGPFSLSNMGTDEAMKDTGFTIVGLGEVLWDVFPDGPRFGGAPANFASTCKQLAGERADAYVVSAVGRDALGDAALRELFRLSVHTELVQRSERETGQVLVELDSQGKASYRFIEHPAWDELAWTDAARKLAVQTDAVCFGTLAQRSQTSRHSIEQFLDHCPEKSWKVLDLNLRFPYFTEECIVASLKRANALKLNEDELPVVAELLQIKGNDREILGKLQAMFRYRFVALTRGAHGSAVQADRWTEMPANPVAIKDTVGAGDAFTAALVLGALLQHPWDRVQSWATDVAGYVASQSGATPALPNELCLPQ